MKKSIRILSILMAFAMLIGSFSVMGSAYQAYKGSAISGQYNDVDAPEFTLEQYASMGLDEVDRMLAKEQMVLDLLGMLTLDLSSIDATIASVLGFLETGGTLIMMLGDASSLPKICAPLQGVSRAAKTDLQVIYALLDFISNLKDIASSYVKGTVDVGLLNGFIADFKFDVRELALGILYGLTPEGENAEYDYFDDKDDDGVVNGLPAKYKTETAAITLLQDLLNGIVLGEWKLLNEELADEHSVVMAESYAFVDYTTGEDVSNKEIDTANYHYYGWRHENDWVTVGLGDAYRVKINKENPEATPVPAASYSVVDVNGGKVAYDFIELLMQRAYNYIAVPVLNRDTRGWVLELCGYTIDETKANRTVFDEATGEWIDNPTYDRDYVATAPSSSEGLTEIAALFNHEAIANGTAVVPKATIPAGETFVDNFNKTLGEFVTIFATNNKTVDGVECSWTWEEGGNDVLFNNIISLGKYVVCVTGDLFFSDRAQLPSVEEIKGYDGQQIVALIMREILNNSVDYIYVDDSHQTIVDVAYKAVEQLAWQDIPQYTYTKPSAADYSSPALYYRAVVEKMIDILFDIAVYNLNQGFDMNPADGNDPDDFDPATSAHNGLLQYQDNNGSYEENLKLIVSWAITTYGKILALDFKCDDKPVNQLTADDAWMDIDTLIDAIIPIKGGEGKAPWIHQDIAGNGTTIVSKTFIFDYILAPLYNLDATNIAKILQRNTAGGAFATMTGVPVILDLLENIFNLLFPGVFQKQNTLDQVLQNELLGDMVHDLIGSLAATTYENANGVDVDGRGDSIAAVALPVVCMLLGLSDDQEFEEMEIYLPGTISYNEALPTFEVFNGSSGINTAYTDKNGAFDQDELYTYVIDSVALNTYDANGNSTSALNYSGIKKGDAIAGGDSLTVSLSGQLTSANNGDLVEFKVTYIVLDEFGKAMTADAEGAALDKATVLTKTVYGLIGVDDRDDDAIEQTKSIADGREIKYEKAIYLAGGDDLDDIESYMIRVQDIKKENTETTANVTGVSTKNADGTATNYPFATVNEDTNAISAQLTGEEGLYFLTPFDVATYAAKDENGADITKKYERFEYIYETDEEGNVIIDKTTGEPANIVGNNAGVPDGAYKLTTNLTVAGAPYSVDTVVHVYDDYGLESAFNNAVLANRQLSDYDKEADDGAANGLYTAYTNTLKKVARFVLKPKTSETFQNDIKASSNAYDNKYEEYAEELAAAIEALEEYELNAGIGALKELRGEYSGNNYEVISTSEGSYKKDLEYDDEDYVYFGMRDYVPHTYNKYRIARDRVSDLIESQEIFIPAPFTDADIYGANYEPSEEEKAARAEALLAYEDRMANKGVVGSIESLYAQHMMNLSGERLIRLPANTSKLQIVYDMCKNAIPEGKEANYTVSSRERYQRAIAFTEKTLDTAITVNGEPNLRPSQVNQATTELMEAWKKLALGAEYDVLDAAIQNAQNKLTEDGVSFVPELPAEQSVYSPETYKPFYDAYNEAMDVDRDLSATESNNQLISDLATALNTAKSALEFAKSAEPKFELITEDPELFWDVTWEISYIPVIDEEVKGMYEMDQETADGDIVDGYIFGLGQTDEGWSEEMIESIFQTLDNCYIEITPDIIYDSYGNGTIVQIKDSNTDNVIKTYCLIIVGDLNGDGFMDNMDVMKLREFDAEKYLSWMDEPTEIYQLYSGDINGDGWPDQMDVMWYRESLVPKYGINQVTREKIALP